MQSWPSTSLVNVHEPNRLVECSQWERQRRFQQLVRRYLVQILHGCKSTCCNTPLCLSSSSKRNTSQPVRPPTRLTARILAHYLASQDNPQQGLCRHEPKVPLEAVEIDYVASLCVRQLGEFVHNRSHLIPQSIEYSRFLVRPPAWQLNPPRWWVQQDASTMDAIGAYHQAKKDAKSLGQNLHDSAAVIYNYSKRIPSLASAIALLRTAEQSSQTDVGKHGKQAGACLESTSHHDCSPDSHLFPNSASNSSCQSTTPLPRAGRLNTPDTAPPSSCTFAKQTINRYVVVRREQKSSSFHKQSQETAPGHAGTLDTWPIIQHKSSLPVVTTLNCQILDELKERVPTYSRYASNQDGLVDFDASCRPRTPEPFIDRSLFYTLSDPATLLKSFHDDNEAFKDSPLDHLDSSRLASSLRGWQQRHGALIFDSLWTVLEALFTPPPELDVQKSPRLKPSHKLEFKETGSKGSSDNPAVAASSSRYLSNREAAHIVLVCIHALTSLVSVGPPQIWAELRRLRSWGITIPSVPLKVNGVAYPYLNIVDELEYEPAVRLANRLLRAVGSRTCFEHILASLSGREKQQKDCEHTASDATLIDIVLQHLRIVERVALANGQTQSSCVTASTDPGWTVTATFIEWLRTIVIKEWDGKAELSKWGSVGTAVNILDKLHASWESLNLRPHMFEMPFFHERLKVVEEPMTLLNWCEQPNVCHILQYPALFSAQHIVSYFRTINFASMMAQYENTVRNHQMQKSLDMFLREPYLWVIKSRMIVTLSDFFVLDVSRGNVLKDTLDQLWGQDRRMLLKPLKVIMGHQDGEVGLDHGGVTNEFFHIVLGEAFRPDSGMFVIDPESRMTWFQPRTLEPDWKFEMLGILFSLALYNGVTLPVTFPLAFYHFLLPIEGSLRDRRIQADTLDFIKDGWPSLTKAFEWLLTWSEGDVKDVVMRDYVFSFEAFGQKIDHNMTLAFAPQQDERYSPTSRHLSEGDVPLVTNSNREQFVKDYIHFLTHLSVEPQLEAFRKGFFTCIRPRSLLFFTPWTLRDLVEGTQHISISGLRRCAKYEDGYSANHPIIVNFWSIVGAFGRQERQRLLEFVTASDRVPMTGYEGITFCIVRLGGDMESLPTSSTCFGKLFLPEYSGKDRMKEKLELALQNSQGFGVV